MNRTDVINYVIHRFGFESYLEIGVQFPHSNYDKISARRKVGIEPFPAGDWLNLGVIKLTSDEFFRVIQSEVKYDVIFIDGLHTREQCRIDIQNSLHHLSDNGFIFVHDCLPTGEYQTSPEDNGREWTGDVWKAIVDIQSENGLGVCTIDTDWGIGCIKKDRDKTGITNTLELTWESYTLHKRELLNIKSVGEWQKWL